MRARAAKVFEKASILDAGLFKSIRKDREAVPVESSLRERSLLVGRLGQLHDEAVVPGERIPLDGRHGPERIAEDVSQEGHLSSPSVHIRGRFVINISSLVGSKEAPEIGEASIILNGCFRGHSSNSRHSGGDSCLQVILVTVGSYFGKPNDSFSCECKRGLPFFVIGQPIRETLGHFDRLAATFITEQMPD
jgi:hypothetical protein